jgi:natural product biosynthesis luciferase-like monooxygenase protein
VKFGLNFFPSFRASYCSTAEYFAQCLRLAERADALGFDSIKTVEHYFYDYGGHSPNPVTLLAAVAARTRRIRVITGAVIPAFNHPVKLAAELAALDNLSNGRLDAGFGRAFIPKEFEVFGVPMEDSRARFEEGLDLVIRLWTEDRVSHDGKFHRLRDVHLNPRPLQKPHPPVWVAAIASPESFISAGRRGWNIMIVPFAAGGIDKVGELVATYRRAWRDAGHTPGAEKIQSSLHCYVAETHAAAVAGARPRVERYIEVFTEAVGSWSGHQSAQYAGYGKMVETISRTTIDSMLASHQALIGTPDEVVEQLRYHRDVFGEFEPSMQVNFGGIGDAEALRTLELFASGVMPRFP